MNGEIKELEIGLILFTVLVETTFVGDAFNDFIRTAAFRNNLFGVRMISSFVTSFNLYYFYFILNAIIKDS
jgi:hypothetical protein